MNKTLRLLFPQWQGGDYGNGFAGQIYPLGAYLLAFLAPKSKAPIIEVPVETYTGQKPKKTDTVIWQDHLLKQLQKTQEIIKSHQPKRIITFGGDCSVDQAPFAYLNEIYENLALLWIDAHADTASSKNSHHEHQMVLANLLGYGDPVLTKEVQKPYKASQILIIGAQNIPEDEYALIKTLNIDVIPPQEIKNNNQPVLDWLNKHHIHNLAIHIDLDCLDPTYFYSQLLKNPDTEPFKTTSGQFTLKQLTHLLKDISTNRNVAGIGFTEFMPWDALNLQKMMAELPFMK